MKTLAEALTEVLNEIKNKKALDNQIEKDYISSVVKKGVKNERQ